MAIKATWGYTRTLRRLDESCLMEVTLHPRQDYAVPTQARAWAYITVLGGTLLVSVDQGSLRTVEPGNRLGAPPNTQIMVRNQDSKLNCVFTVLLVLTSSNQGAEA